MKLKIFGITGYLSDPILGEQLHSLQHQGRVESLLIQPQDVARHRLRALTCLLYTSPSPRDATLSRMPSSA